LRGSRFAREDFPPRHVQTASLACGLVRGHTSVRLRIEGAGARTARIFFQRGGSSAGSRQGWPLGNRFSRQIAWQGRMRPHRITITTSTLAAICLAIAPAAAAGSPLLSGYGGPGAGEQQIIGSTLVGGGSGHGGGSGNGGSAGSSNGGRESGGSGSETSSAYGTSSSSGSSGGASTGASSSGVGGGEGAGGHAGKPGSRSGSGGQESQRSGEGSSAKETGAAGKSTSSGGGSARLPGAVEAAAEQPVAFGLSSGEVAVVAAIVAGLLLTGVLTWWLGALERKRFGADDAHMSPSSRR